MKVSTKRLKELVQHYKETEWNEDADIVQDLINTREVLSRICFAVVMGETKSSRERRRRRSLHLDGRPGSFLEKIELVLNKYYFSITNEGIELCPWNTNQNEE